MGAVNTTLSPILPREHLGVPRPLTQGELDKMLPELSKLVMDKLPAINEKMRLAQEEARRLREQVQEVDNSIQAKENRLQDLQSKASNLRAEEQELRANAQGLRAKEQELRAEEQTLKDEAQRLRESASKREREVLAKRFYSIFIFDGKKPLAAEQIDQFFNTYLKDGYLSLFEADNGDVNEKLSSMKPVISYLAEHPDINIKGCDFRFLKTHVGDIPTLAEFLKKSTVKAIAINSGIPAEAKASLSEAIAARNGGLKVQYYA